MEDDHSLSIRDPLCSGIQTPTHSLVDKMNAGVSLNIAEASDRQGGGVLRLSRTVERGAVS
jgi:hypothetical protein